MSATNEMQKMTNLKSMIMNIAWIENTRMLFDFVNTLSNDHSIIVKNPVYYGNGGLAGRNSLLIELNKEIKSALKECMDLQGNYLYMNRYADYLQFYNENLFNNEISYDSLTTGGGQICPLTYCVRFFWILNVLSNCPLLQDFPFVNSWDQDTLPYLYEDLCFTFCEMIGCRETFIVYSEDGQAGKLITQSGYLCHEENTEENDITIRDLDKILANEKNNLFESLEDVYKVSPDKCSGSEENTASSRYYYYLSIPVQENEIYNLQERTDTKAPPVAPKGKNRPHFNIIFSFDSEADDIVRTNCLKILFLRYRLRFVLEKEFTMLTDLRYNCEYVQSVDKNFSGESLPKILFIADSHIENNPAANIKFIDDFEKQFNECTEKDDIDLLVLAGDIVNASNNAADAQAKYKEAKHCFRKIANLLWGQEVRINHSIVKYLPHDWKRRILIVPGNHDYTTMSDVIVETESRKIKAAFPSSQSAGTLSKLTYYIEFVADFLDVPITRLVKNDMNEIRSYNKLNLIIGSFNTVANANSMQNNKVGFSPVNIIDTLIKTSKWMESDYHRVILVHHSRAYDINYFDDKYSLWNYIENMCPKEKCGTATSFTDCSKSPCDILKCDYYLGCPHCSKCNECFVRSTSKDKPSEQIKSILKEYTDIFEELIDPKATFPDSITDQRKSISEFIKNISDNPQCRLQESSFYSDCKSLIAILDKMSISKDTYIPLDEYDHDFLNKNKSLLQIQKSDNKSFMDSWNKIMHGSKTTILAGHVHKRSESDSDGVYIESKFFIYNKTTKEYRTSFSVLRKQNEGYERVPK